MIMILKEFKDRVDKLLGRGWDDNFTDVDFENVSLVYAYHPMISDMNGKDQIAELYATGRMGIIDDMCHTAAEVASCECTIQANSVTMEKIKKHHQGEIRDLLDKQKAEIDVIIKDTNHECLRLEKTKKPYLAGK